MQCGMDAVLNPRPAPNNASTAGNQPDAAAPSLSRVPDLRQKSRRMQLGQRPLRQFSDWARSATHLRRVRLKKRTMEVML